VTSVPCIHNDGGHCSIPQQTVLVTHGTVSIRSRQELEETFPAFDLERTTLTSVPFGGHSSIVEALTKKKSQQAAAEVESAVVAAAQGASITAGIVVRCSCGHELIADAATASASAGELAEV
jgi:hypothetical protein